MLNLFGIRTKVPLTKDQQQVLHGSYLENAYPSKETKVQLANSLKLSVVKVSQWFKDQRKKHSGSTQ